MATAVVLGWLSVIVGLTVSYHADTAASASVAGTAVVVFFVVLAGSELWRVVRRPQLAG
jgi:manganese/iron transport system permease protein